VTTGPVLRVYRLGPDVPLDGTLVGALERAVLSGDVLLDALLVGRDAAGGEVQAIDLSVASADGTLSALLDFRLDPVRRADLTRRTLAEHPGGVPVLLLEEIAASLQAGDAVLALLHRGRAEALDDAVARCGGWCVDARPVQATTLPAATAEVAEALTRRHEEH
jgi:hypothetical protein